MFSSPPSAVRTRRSTTVLCALAMSGALLLTPAVAAPASAATDPATPAAPAAADETAASALTLSAAELVEGATLQVSYRTDAPHEKNWIGIYGAGDEVGPVPSRIWDYAPGTEGGLEFTLDLAPGQYEVRFLAQDGYEHLAGPYALTITADPERPQPGDPTAPVVGSAVVTDASTDGVIAREGFGADGLPVGWSVDSSADDDAAYGGWTFTTRSDWTASIDEMRARFARPLGTLAVADAQQAGGALETTLTSAPVTVEGLASVRLTFDSHYRGAAGQSASVRVSFDGGESREVLRLDSETVADGYDARQMNYAQDIVVEVPEGAQDAVFSWEFAAEEDGRYWAIDSVTAHAVQRAAETAPTQAWVMSDIQGHPGDWQHALGDYAQISPDADGMLVVGDIVNTGAEAEWQEIYDVMDATADIRPRQTVASIGNHERYAPGGFEANVQRFFEFAGRDSVWDEYVLEGPSGDLPVIVLGQEFASPSDVAMSDGQVEFLEERLEHWTEQDSQVVVITHFPLGDTVSASWIPWYHGHHQMNDRLTGILGNHPNAIVFSGHTHYPAELGDWAVQRRTAEGHPDGFWAVNTLAMHVEWDARGENTVGIDEITTGDINRGLTVDSYGDRVVVTAHDFATDEVLRRVEIPNPLVPFDAELQPEPEEPTEPTDPTDPVDPTDPTEPEEPTEPTDPTDPVDPTDPTDPTDPVDPTEPAEPGDDGGQGEGGQGGAADGGAGSGDLATTGADAAWAVPAAAAGLLALGVGSVLLVRRRLS